MTIKSWLAGAAALSVVAVGAAMTVAPAASASGLSPHPAGVTKVTSQKWAGYAALADKGKNLRYIAADFTVPAPAACTGSGMSGGVGATQWIGLDGYSGGTAEQIGVGESCDYSVDEISYYAFYSGTSGNREILGCNQHGNTCPGAINPGDRVKLSVYYNGKTYRLILNDVTEGVYRRFYERCSKCRSNSAEVINQIGYSATGPLAALFTVNLLGVRVTSADGKHGALAPQARYWTTTEITQLDSGGHILAAPSALLRTGQAFSLSAAVPSG
jgi:hypothetical protein